jgi:hypothetical protein
MDDTIDDLIESGQRLRVYTTWLPHGIEGRVNDRIWRADPHSFFPETDDHEVYALDRRDPSPQMTIADAP